MAGGQSPSSGRLRNAVIVSSISAHNRETWLLEMQAMAIARTRSPRPSGSRHRASPSSRGAGSGLLDDRRQRLPFSAERRGFRKPGKELPRRSLGMRPLDRSVGLEPMGSTRGTGLPDPIAIAVTKIDAPGAALAVRRPGQALDLQSHQPLRGNPPSRAATWRPNSSPASCEGSSSKRSFPDHVPHSRVGPAGAPNDAPCRTPRSQQDSAAAWRKTARPAGA